MAKIKGQTMIYKTLLRKLTIKQHEPNWKPEMNACGPERFDGLVYFIATSLPLHKRNSCSVEISIKYLDVYLTSKIINILFNRSKLLRIKCYVWFKDDKHVIWMWIWLILKNISLLDRIWSLWFVRFSHSPPNFIFWLGRLIFSVSINSHPDNICISSKCTKILYLL